MASIDHESHDGKSRRRARRAAFAVAGAVVAAGLFVVAVRWRRLAEVLAGPPAHTDNVGLTLANRSGLPIDDAAFGDGEPADEQAGLFASPYPNPPRALPAGQTYEGSHSWGNMRIAGLWFRQGGRTFHVPLDGSTVVSNSHYSITVTPGLVTTVCDKPNSPTLTFVQKPQ